MPVILRDVPAYYRGRNHSEICPARSPATGTGIFDTGLLAAGTHAVTAAYQGDAKSAPGTSAPVLVVVNGITTTTSLAPLPAAPQVGSTFALTAAVSAPSGSLFGQVSFFDGTALLGTRALDSSSVAVLTIDGKS